MELRKIAVQRVQGAKDSRGQVKFIRQIIGWVEKESAKKLADKYRTRHFE